MIRRIVVVLALCIIPSTVCLAQQSNADQPATLADIGRYFEATHVRELMKSTMDTVSKQMRQMLHAQIANTPNLPPDAEQRMDKMFDGALQNMPIDDLMKAMAPVYAKHFSKGDIDTIVAFYSTPTGQKMVAEMPAINQEAMQASSGVIRKYMDDTMRQLQAQIEEMQKDDQTAPKKSVTTN
jgi:uncharacterized protein